MPRFKAGDAVRVRSLFPPGHARTPYYARGKCGVIERICGTFNNPEHLAYGHPDDPKPLYRVRFSQSEFWAPESAHDTVDIEIYEHWLEPA